MKVCVIGTGYVGLVVGACLADSGNEVICVDCDKEKLSNLENGIIPIYEPLLEDLIKTNVKEKRLSFTSDTAYAVKNSLVCFIAVGTPSNPDGSCNLDYVKNAAKSIGQAIEKYTIIVNKSTIPVGGVDLVHSIIKEHTNVEFDVVSNPEFLKQGNAVEDFIKPDRVVIGTDSEKAYKIMEELYTPYLRTGNPILNMDVKSAELTKYASNCFLAMKISYINQIANICEKIGADVENIRQGMSFDKRIGNQFLFAGLGFGGSCFPKDVKALINTASNYGCEFDLLKAIEDVNARQKKIFVEKIKNRFNDLKGLTIAVWGLSFKPKTNDMREAPSIDIINTLLDLGAKIQAYDPKAADEAKKYFADKITYTSSCYEALNGANALLLLTEWSEFQLVDFSKIKSLMKNPVIFDGRNQYNFKKLEEMGFEYYKIGKNCDIK